MPLQVLEPGFISTVQDLGRTGYERFGVPVSGAMDWFALSSANALVGNPWNSAALEMALVGPKFIALENMVIAVTGMGFELKVQGRQCPTWTAVYVRYGETIELISKPEGGWGYLACAGGLDTPIVMGSRSTYMRGGFGGMKGRSLRSEDLLPVGQPTGALQSLAGRELSEEDRLPYSPVVTLDAIPGPQAEAFSTKGLHNFLEAEYQISGTSDRMGYRLDGPPVEHESGADLISEGLVFGSVQVPANDQPIVMMADRQTTGGYTKIATLTRSSLPLIAQCPVGSGRVRFRWTTVEAAQAQFRQLVSIIQSKIIDPDDNYYGEI